jgi:acyl-CoA synthetase (AMP-forming)/AMP-acid ligase II
MTGTGLFSIREMIWNGQDPDQNAIESPGYLPLTYRELREQIQYVVRDLNARGFFRNDRIAILIPAGPEAAVSILSVMAGFTVVPLNPHNREQEYADIFSRVGIKAIIVQKNLQTDARAVAMSQKIPVLELVPSGGKAGIFELLPKACSVTREPEFATSSDIAYILLTAGTTSASKIVSFSQRRSGLSRQLTAELLKITDNDRCLHIVPYYHGMGIASVLLVPLSAGGTVICSKEFIPSDFLHLLKTCRPTYCTAGPALHQGILRNIKKVPPAELKPNSLRFIRSGSAALPTSVRSELEILLGVPLIEAYYMSETGIISINIPQKSGSVGIPVIEFLRIVDEQGTVCRKNEQGEIIVKGETVFSGYENAPSENDAAFIDGWFRTGDVGYLDDDGYLFLTGRKKELINKGGEKISPEEIDTVLHSHPLVKEAMVFPVRDPVLGEDIAAMVVPGDQKVTENDLRIYLLDRLVPFKVPRRIYLVDEIPRNPVGKPLRQVGTQRYSQK